MENISGNFHINIIKNENDISNMKLDQNNLNIMRGHQINKIVGHKIVRPNTTWTCLKQDGNSMSIARLRDVEKIFAQKDDVNTTTNLQNAIQRHKQIKRIPVLSGNAARTAKTALRRLKGKAQNFIQNTTSQTQNIINTTTSTINQAKENVEIKMKEINNVAQEKFKKFQETIGDKYNIIKSKLENLSEEIQLKALETFSKNKNSTKEFLQAELKTIEGLEENIISELCNTISPLPTPPPIPPNPHNLTLKSKSATQTPVNKTEIQPKENFQDQLKNKILNNGISNLKKNLSTLNDEILTKITNAINDSKKITDLSNIVTNFSSKDKTAENKEQFKEKLKKQLSEETGSKTIKIDDADKSIAEVICEALFSDQKQ